VIGFTLLFEVLGKICGIVFGRLENVWMISKRYFIDSRIKEWFLGLPSYFRAVHTVEHTSPGVIDLFTLINQLSSDGLIGESQFCTLDLFFTRGVKLHWSGVES
jgi:hypothetical protein